MRRLQARLLVAVLLAMPAVQAIAGKSVDADTYADVEGRPSPAAAS